MQVDGLLISIPWVAAMLFILFRWFPSISRSQLTILFGVKVAFTFLLQAIYTYHFDDRSAADIYRFFDDGIILNHIFSKDPGLFVKIIFGIDGGADAHAVFEQMNSWIKPFDSGFYNDNHAMIKINALLRFVSAGYYEVHGLIFSFASFTGLLLLVKSLLDKKDQILGTWLVVLFPSSLIWLSGGLKESLLIFGLAITVSGLMTKATSLKRSMLFAFGIFILSSIKLYFLVALTPALLIWFVQSKKSINWTRQLALWALIALSGYGILFLLGFDIADYIVRKQHEFLNHSSVINPGSAFDMDYLEFSLTSVVSNLPNSLINSLIRPFVWEWNGPAEGLMMLESLDVLLTILVVVYFTIKNREIRQESFWILTFIIPVIALIGLTTPVFGAVMRYRAPCLVFLYIYSAPYIRQLLIRRSA